jgi:hypothetical protein
MCATAASPRTLRRSTEDKLSDEAATPDANWTKNTSGQIEDIGDNGESDRRLTLLTFAKGVEPSRWRELLPARSRKARRPHLGSRSSWVRRRRCIALDTQLSAEEWLEQLQIECDIKNAPRRARH